MEVFSLGGIHFKAFKASFEYQIIMVCSVSIFFYKTEGSKAEDDEMDEG